MDRTSAIQTGSAPQNATRESLGQVERAFNLSMVASGIRCVLAYVVLPFVTPLLGIAPGVGPTLGIAIAVVAIGANVISMRRFWRVQHRWRTPVTVLHVGVIGFLLALIAVDVAALIS